MSNLNILTHLDFKHPVRQRTDYCTVCGKYKSAIERWNECACKSSKEARIVDSRLGGEQESERRKPVPPNFEFSNPLVNRGKTDYTTDWGLKMRSS